MSNKLLYYPYFKISLGKASFSLLPTVLMSAYNFPVNDQNTILKLVIDGMAGLGAQIYSNVTERKKLLEKSDFSFSFYLKNNF